MTGPSDVRPSDQLAHSRLPLRLPGSSHAPATVRRFLRSALTGRVPAEVLDTVLLLGSELVTNAALHANGDIEIAVGENHGQVLVEVSDRSPHPHASRSATSAPPPAAGC